MSLLLSVSMCEITCNNMYIHTHTHNTVCMTITFCSLWLTSQSTPQAVQRSCCEHAAFQHSPGFSHACFFAHTTYCVTHIQRVFQVPIAKVLKECRAHVTQPITRSHKTAGRIITNAIYTNIYKECGRRRRQ